MLEPSTPPPRARQLVLIGASSSIGIRPYDDRDEPRHLDQAPDTLRALGLPERLQASDLGNVRPPPYRDFRRTEGKVRNEADVAGYTHALAARIDAALENGQFPLVLGGDCSIVLASLLAARRRARPIGLAYVDGHADFASPQESATGSAASMCLALAVGRGDSVLARLSGDGPLVQPADVVLIGRRDEGEPYGHEALSRSGVLDIPGKELMEAGGSRIAHRALKRFERADLHGFWIHVDADVLDASVMSAVDSPEPDGPGITELSELVAPLVHHPAALGMQLTIYDPGLDPDRSCGRRLVTLLENVFGRRSV
jgi:arginase